jgi:DnaJ like chaperone protein
MRRSPYIKILLQCFLFFAVCVAALILTDEQWGPSITLGIFSIIVYNIITFGNGLKETHLKNKYHFLDSESDFTNILLRLIAEIVSVDGKEVGKELKYVQSILSKYFDGVRVKELLSAITFFIDKGDLNYEPICKILAVKFNYQSKIQLMHLLTGICATDSLISKKEEALLKNVAREIRLPFATFNQILLMHHFKYEREKEQNQYRRKRTKYTSQSQLKTAYGILGIAESAESNQIKKAYRKLAVIHHPDKVAYLGGEIQKLAKEKFQIISDAYELIKKKKGFS